MLLNDKIWSTHDNNLSIWYNIVYNTKEHIYKVESRIFFLRYDIFCVPTTDNK